jgi:hypothetical protein
MNCRWLCILFLVSCVASADERILSYHSDILVRDDGWIEVTETIRIRAEGSQIRRGIYRDYPTDYTDKFGNDVKMLYEPRSLLRNGSAEPFNSEKYGNGVRTYFGSSDRLLEPGEHTYVYRYDAGRMLGFFPDKDELWWNVTGLGWAFPIDKASASVTLGFEVPFDSLELGSWQGPYQSSETGRTDLSESGQALFGTTRQMGIGENFSVTLRWPKGHVPEPSGLQKFIWVLADNLNLLTPLAGLAAIFGYYIPVWQNYGKDPVPGVILTRYEPPKGFSPASLRYIENMGYDNETMTVGVVSLAVKGYLRINEEDGEHTLQRLDPGDNPPALATGEAALYEELFRKRDLVVLKDENHEIIGGARTAHERSLKFDYHKKYFKTNGLLNLPPLLIMTISAMVALSFGPSFLVIATIALMVVTTIAFAILLKRPTASGRRLMDDSAGFAEFLEIAEKDEMNLRNPPEKTPQLFEQYLPFALALGVEQEWAERFARIFASLRGPNDTTWHPAWYNGSWDNIDLSVSTASMSSSLGGAISSSASPPGSSSSGGGGGFSGGGGGGGGGGGW